MADCIIDNGNINIIVNIEYNIIVWCMHAQYHYRMHLLVNS